MSGDSSKSSKKSTNVQSLMISTAQFAFRQVSAWAPNAAEQLALRLFMTPSRRMKRAEPRLPGVPGKRITLRSHPYRLRVWEWGDGPTVLLVHGWSGQASQWQPFARALVDAGYRVLAPDLPAHGFSSGRRTTLPHFVRAVRTVACYAGPLTAIVAHSLGATASSLALAAGVDAARVVLIAPPSNVPHYIGRVAEFIGLPPDRLPNLLARVERVAGVPLESLNLPKVAPLLDTPALILHSKGDREVPFEHGHAIAQAWRGAQLVALEGGAHTRVLQEPQVIGAALAFIGRQPSRAPQPVPEAWRDQLSAYMDDGDRMDYRAAL